MCCIWTGYRQVRKGGTYGQINVKIDNKWTAMNVQGVAYMCSKSLIVGSDLDISHLCHNSLCVNAVHLVAEPRHINNHSQACLSLGQCQGHGDYPHSLLDLRL